MRHYASAAILAGILLLVPARPASAQRVSFERSYTVGASPTLDVTTSRGKIDVSIGTADRIEVRGSATVRLGLTSPSDAYELVKKVAANPPIRQDGDTVRLRPPSAPEEQRAMTIAYVVMVPRGTVVRTSSDSGETRIAGVSGRVSIRTGSASISVRDLGGDTEVTTQSGAVDADSVAGNLSVSTESSRVSARNLGGGLRVRTQSGDVEGTFRGKGNVDIGTASSAIDLVGVNGGLTATSNSGRIRISGLPTAPWQVTSGSGSFELEFDSNAKLTLDATSGSGSVRVEGSRLQGSTSKGAVSGTVGGGGPLVRANSRSGSIRIAVR